MDVATYWQNIKKQSKELTGVDKINAGLFHKSGVAGALDDYIIAVKAGNLKKMLGKLATALDKCEKYYNTVHKKLVAEGKKSLKPNEQKSAKIIDDALVKIIEQLKKVQQDPSLAGSFDEDADSDAKKSHEPLDPKLEKAAQAHVDLRLKVAEDGKKYLAMYKSNASKVPAFLKIAQRGASDAKSSKQEGNTFNNMQAIAQANRAVEEIEQVIKEIEAHYKKNFVDGSSDFMKARGEFGDRDKLPSWYKPGYMKEHNAAWSKATAAANEINVFRKTLVDAVNSAREAADVAENFSMQGIDPQKLITKLEKLEPEAEKLFKDANLQHMRVVEVPDKLKEVMKGLTGEALTKAVTLRENEAKKRIAQVVEFIKQGRTLRGRVKAIANGAEDRQVIEAAGRCDGHLDLMDDLLKNFQADARTTLSAVEEAKSFAATSGV